jgi:hypothetical protein
MEDDLTAVGKLAPVTPDQFAQAALDPVADNSTADAPRNAQTDAPRP